MQITELPLKKVFGKVVAVFKGGEYAWAYLQMFWILRRKNTFVISACL